MTVGFAIGLVSPLLAQLPGARLFTCSPAGGRQGTTFDVTVGGADLDGARALYFSQTGITWQPKLGPPSPLGRSPEPLPNVFTVTIAADAAVGLCDVRVVGKFGVSNPRTFQIGSLAEVAEIEPNNTLAQSQVVPLETTVNGVIGGATDMDCFKVALKAGQRLFADCWAQRLDSRLEAVIVLFDATGLEVGRSRATGHQDPSLDFTAPADGECVVKIYDSVYAGSGEYFYRLSLSTAPRVDFVLPFLAAAATKSQITLHGRGLPGGQPVEGMTLDGKPLVKLSVEVELPGGLAAESLALASTLGGTGSLLDLVAHRLPPALGVVEPLALGFATQPVVLESEPNNSPGAAQKVTAPCDFTGQFYPQNDEDWLAFDVKSGVVFVIEIFSHRLGSLTDPLLLVQHIKKNDKGEEQVQELQSADDLGGNIGGTNFDTGSDDAAFRFQAPADGVCRIFVRDQYSATSADPRNVYRLSIRPETPDFRLVAVPRFPGANPDPNANPPNAWNPLLRRGGTDLFEVLAIRRDGFGGEIQVTLEGLPSWVRSSTASLGPNDVSTPMVLSAAPDAMDWVGTVEVVGRARIGEQNVQRRARAGVVVWPGIDNTIAPRSRVARSLVLGVSSEVAPFSVEAAAGVLEMARGGTLQVPVTLTRRGDFKGPVALAAVGLPPNVAPKNITLDPNTASANFELGVQPGAPPGTYTFHLHATSQVAYARNPEQVEITNARKVELDQLVTTAQAALKLATDGKAVADKAAADATAALALATEAQGKIAGEGKPAADQLRAAADEVKKLADAARAASEKSAAEADARLKAATEAQAAAVKAIEAATNAAKPQNINVAFASTPVTLRIVTSPIGLTVFAPAGPLKAGQKLDVPLLLERRFGFADAVAITAAAPPGVAGLTIAAVTLAAGQTQAVLSIVAAAEATPGNHTITVTGVAKFGGQDAPTVQTITLTVEKP